MLNAATLQFDFSATQDILGNNIGIQPGSYIQVDTSVVNSSITPSSGLFEDAIVGGHVEVVDLNGPTTYDSGETTSISTTNDGTNTTWIIPVETGPQSAEIQFTFSGVDLTTDLSDDYNIYNDSFVSGVVITANPLGGDLNLPVGDDFLVSDVSPVPLPPTFYLMASSLIMLLWRSNLSFSDIKTLTMRA
jgi:hypothetical protein